MRQQILGVINMPTVFRIAYNIFLKANEHKW